MDKISGIYKITNTITSDFYIGSSNDIEKRWANHKSPSQWKHQPNSKLYKDMTSYGLDNFIFEIIEETSSLKEREQYWIEQMKPSYNSKRAKGWNIEQYKEAHRRCNKEWNKSHQNERLAMNKVYYSRLCLYKGKTLTLNALSARFSQQGIPHPTLEAKEYLI